MNNLPVIFYDSLSEVLVPQKVALAVSDNERIIDRNSNWLQLCFIESVHQMLQFSLKRGNKS